VKATSILKFFWAPLGQTSFSPEIQGICSQFHEIRSCMVHFVGGLCVSVWGLSYFWMRFNVLFCLYTLVFLHCKIHVLFYLVCKSWLLFVDFLVCFAGSSLTSDNCRFKGITRKLNAMLIRWSFDVIFGSFAWTRFCLDSCNQIALWFR